MKKIVLVIVFAVLVVDVFAVRLLWTPSGLVLIDGWAVRKFATAKPVSAQELEQRRVVEQEARRLSFLRQQQKAQRLETQQHVRNQPCVLPCRMLPIPRTTQPRLFPELCARRRLGPSEFWLLKAGELCCCP
ncbi:hypothetical protein HY490_01995 [Candidatus Woesearchaeota archaeon]|nr:hypothetical protein [Candidatus Woesearchaeota archaeon]